MGINRVIFEVVGFNKNGTATSKLAAFCVEDNRGGGICSSMRSNHAYAYSMITEKVVLTDDDTSIRRPANDLYTPRD